MPSTSPEVFPAFYFRHEKLKEKEVTGHDKIQRTENFVCPFFLNFKEKKLLPRKQAFTLGAFTIEFAKAP